MFTRANIFKKASPVRQVAPVLPTKTQFKRQARLFGGVAQHRADTERVGPIFASRQQIRRQRIAEAFDPIDLYCKEKEREALLDDGIKVAPDKEQFIIPTPGKVDRIKASLKEKRLKGIKKLKIDRIEYQETECQRMDNGIKAILSQETAAAMMPKAGKCARLKNLIGDIFEITSRSNEEIAKTQFTDAVAFADWKKLVGVLITMTSFIRASRANTPGMITKKLNREFARMLRHAGAIIYVKKICPQRDGTPHIHALIYFENQDYINDFMDKESRLGSIKVRPIFDSGKAIQYLFSSWNSRPDWAKTWGIRANECSRKYAPPKEKPTKTFIQANSKESQLWRVGQDLAREWVMPNGEMPKVWLPEKIMPRISHIRTECKKFVIRRKANELADCRIRSVFIGSNDRALIKKFKAEVKKLDELDKKKKPAVSKAEYKAEYDELTQRSGVRPSRKAIAAAKAVRKPPKPSIKQIVKSMTRYVQ